MKKVLFKKMSIVFLAIVCSVSLSGCGDSDGGWKTDNNNWWDDIKDFFTDVGDKIGDAATGAMDWLTGEGKDGIISAYNNVKDGAVYVYNETANFVTDVSGKIANKAEEIVESTKEYFQNLQSDSIQGYTDFVDYEPYATAASEMAATSYLSEIITNYGYDDVYVGAAYYKDYIYGGLIFSDGSYFKKDNDDVVYSCGFLQLTSKKYDGPRLSDSDVENGVIAISYSDGEEKNKSFVVQSCVSISKRGAVYEDVYIEFEQAGNYVMNVSFFDNNSITYPRNIDVLDLKTNIIIQDSYVELEEYEKLMLTDEQVFGEAVEGSNAVANAVEQSGSEVQTLAVMDSNILNNICSKSQQGFKAVENYISNLLGKVKFNDTALLTIDENGGKHVLGSEDAMDSVRTAKGLTESIGSGLGTVAAAGAVATAVIGIAAGHYVIGAIVIVTGTCAIVYNVSNMIEGIQDVYYGSKGSKTESENPVLQAFKNVIKNDSVAELVYHIWGISNNVITTLLNPASEVGTALKIAKSAKFNSFQTAGLLTRTIFVKLAKMVLTVASVGLVYKLVESVTTAVTGSKAFGILLGFGSSLIAATLVSKGLDNLDKEMNLSGIYSDSYVGGDGRRYYFDENRNVYRVDNELMPNSEYKINGFTYQTDGQGRISKASGEIKLNEDGRAPIKDNISTIGRGDQQVGDDRGHLVGDQLGGSNGLENIIAQNSSVNRGEYRAFENLLADYVRSGERVSIEIIPSYNLNSFRPSSILYYYTINGNTSFRTFYNPIP